MSDQELESGLFIHHVISFERGDNFIDLTSEFPLPPNDSQPSINEPFISIYSDTFSSILNDDNSEFLWVN